MAKKLMIPHTDYDVTLNLGYTPLKYIREEVDELIEKYGEEATLYMGYDYDGQSESRLSWYVEETDAEFEKRIADEKKARAAKKAAKAKAEKDKEEAERKLYDNLRSKYENKK